MFHAGPSLQQAGTLSFLDGQVSAALALRSGHEYRFWTLTLVRYLASEGKGAAPSSRELNLRLNFAVRSICFEASGVKPNTCLLGNPECFSDRRFCRPILPTHQKWSQSDNELRHGSWHVIPAPVMSDVAILAVGCRDAGEKGERTRGSSSGQRPVPDPPWFPPAVRLRSDLRQVGRSPYSAAAPTSRLQRAAVRHFHDGIRWKSRDNFRRRDKRAGRNCTLGTGVPSCPFGAGKCVGRCWTPRSVSTEGACPLFGVQFGRGGC